jgi:hypothetical protein
VFTIVAAVFATHGPGLRTLPASHAGSEQWIVRAQA